MRSTLGWLALLQVVSLSTLNGQGAPAPERKWALGLLIGTSTFGGATTGTSDTGDELVFVPYRPTMLGAAITRGRSGLRLGFELKYGEPGIGLRGVPVGGEGQPTQGLLVVIENAYKLTSFTGQVSARVLRLRGGPALRSSLGVSVERWTAPGASARVLFGPQAGVSVEAELTRSLVAAIEGEVGFTSKSPFRAEDLPEGFSQRSTWRRSIGVGLYLRL